MSQQRIQNQRSGSREYGVLIPERKQRADTPTFSALARDFDGQPYQRLKNVGIIFCDLAENTLKHPSHSSPQVNTQARPRHCSDEIGCFDSLRSPQRTKATPPPRVATPENGCRRVWN